MIQESFNYSKKCGVHVSLSFTVRRVRHTNKDQIAAWTAYGASYFYVTFDPQFTMFPL